MKRCFKLFVAVVMVISISVLSFNLTCFAKDYKVENNYSSIEERKESVFKYKVFQMSEKEKLAINSTKKAYDFAGNQYTVIECSPIGYLIFCDSLGIFVEYSPSSVSPYKGYEAGLIYCGPTFYYVLEDNQYYHTINENEKILVSESERYVSSCIKLYEYLEEEKNDLVLDYIYGENQSLSFSEEMANYAASSVNYGYLTNYEFFYDMTSPCGYYCPNGSGGICGYVGLSLIIAYRDKFTDDTYMSDTYWYDSGKNYLIDGSNSFAAFLRNNHGSSDSTYSSTIKTVSESYFSGSSLSVTHTSKLWGTFNRNTIMNAIDNNNPVLLFGSLEDPSDEGNSINHAVVAYKYRDETGAFGETRYTAHFGWNNYSNIYVFGTLGSIYILE